MPFLMKNMLASFGVHRCSFLVLRNFRGQFGNGSAKDLIALTRLEPRLDLPADSPFQLPRLDVSETLA